MSKIWGAVHTVGTFLHKDYIGSLFKRAIDYSCLLGVSVSVQLSTTKVEPEKVTNTVGTFLYKSTAAFLTIRIKTKEIVQKTRALKNRQPELWRSKPHYLPLLSNH